MMFNHNATWINVDEYMPPDNIKVVVRAINKENEAFYYGAYFSYPENRWYFIAYGDGSENLSVTHWMREPAFYPSPSHDYIKSEYGDTK